MLTALPQTEDTEVLLNESGAVGAIGDRRWLSLHEHEPTRCYAIDASVPHIDDLSDMLNGTLRLTLSEPEVQHEAQVKLSNEEVLVLVRKRSEAFTRGRPAAFTMPPRGRTKTRGQARVAWSKRRVTLPRESPPTTLRPTTSGWAPADCGASVVD